ncbi:hypothetical protein F8M41_003729 [Gigaspora margarita]|uniref:Uncharacterized protein n=1 Tax=Gigaspora margarita TaxID=4874 RepID=A0A8H4AY73_GIGMA|nr:hypothetical protein F8M41_003729 [Gigaspora margarita]
MTEFEKEDVLKKIKEQTETFILTFCMWSKEQQFGFSTIVYHSDSVAEYNNDDDDEYDNENDDEDEDKDYEGSEHSSDTQKEPFNFGNSLTMKGSDKTSYFFLANFISKEEEATNEQYNYEEEDDEYEDDYEEDGEKDTQRNNV